MSIPPDSFFRGCASSFAQPVSERDELDAQYLIGMLESYNCDPSCPSPLRDIVFRSGTDDQDICRHVFRWDLTPFEEVFANGFRARRQQDTENEVYVNLDHFVHHGGRPLDSRRPANHIFISTTLSSRWYPTVRSGTDKIVYRYEIFAPGGISVAATLGDRYNYSSQEEVCFVEGIAPQYIRAAQAFRLTNRDGYSDRRRVDNVLTVNSNFNPQSHPQRPLRLLYPIFRYREGGRTGPQQNLTIIPYPPPSSERRMKRQASTTDFDDPTDWYFREVANCESYIDAAFRSSRENEAYIFMKNEYVLVNYAPGTTNDRVLNGPLRICEGFPSLRNTAFAEYGIDSAFRCYNDNWLFGKISNEAFIFSGNLCAHIDYTPGTTDDKIIKGPMTITGMFPFFKGTVFESGVDAAFEATASYEAYLFKGNQYALINYSSDNPKLIAIRLITQGFGGLINTIFESGIDAAFASHRTDEAYLFKDHSYALINFAPGTTDDFIIGGVKEILPNWPSLSGILPRQNCGLDVHEHTEPDPDRDQDELHDPIVPDPHPRHDEL